jgi:hypothetical protein
MILVKTVYTKRLKMYTHTQTSTANCYMADPSSLQGERPTTKKKKNASLLIITKICSWVPEGINAKRD